MYYTNILIHILGIINLIILKYTNILIHILGIVNLILLKLHDVSMKEFY